MLSLSSRELDFGLLHYSPEIAPVTRVFEIKNLDLTRNITVDIENSRKLSNDFPVIVSIFEVDDGIDINDLNLMHRFFDSNVSTSSNTKERTIITLKPLQSKQIVTVLSPYFFNRTSPDFLNTYARTSFSKVIFKVTLLYSILTEENNDDIKIIDNNKDDENKSSDNNKIKNINECKGETDITISAMICTSILYADETDIEFDSCIVGNTYMRDIQIWNRSECQLLYRLSPLLGMVKDLPSISFQEFETGRQLNFDRTIAVPAFASKRIRLVFKAEELGASHFVFRLENINNPTNTSILNCRVNVIVKEESDNLLVELETGTILSSGQVLELGDCYCGLVVYRRMWLKNTGRDSLILTVSTDNPLEVSFDTSGQIPSQLEDKDPLQDTTGKKKEHLLANLQSNPSNSLSIIPNNDISSNNNLIKNARQQNQQSDNNNWLQHSKRSNLRQSDTIAAWGGGGTRERDLASICGLSFGDTWIDENDDDNNYNSEDCRLFIKSKNKKISTIYDKQNIKEHGSKKFLSSYGKDYFNANEFSELLALSFTEKPSIVQSIDRKYEKNINQYESDKNINLSSSVGNINNIIKSKNGKCEPILLSPGMSKPITLLFCPNVDITSASKGSLISKTIKLFLSWKVKTKIDQRIVESDELKNTTVNKTDTSSFTVARYSRKIVCKARTCMSIVSIHPKINDLGECSVGEFRGAFFTLTNESDLPAVILPFIESESISISEKEIKIPPRQRRKITLEYVARGENTDYKREALLLNAFNSHGNVTVEVKAKNVDTHQVLYHSLFYKLSTYNKKRQMQVYFDKCLYNMPNLRVFSIRNIHTEPLLLELLPSDPDVSIFLINHSSSILNNGTIKDNKLINNNENKLFNSGESQERSKHIEDLKWGTRLPLLAPIRRAGSFHDESFTTNEKDTPSIPLNSSNQSLITDIIDPVPITRLTRSGSETSFDSLVKSKQSTTNTISIATVPNLSNINSLFNLNKSGYPFSLIQNNASLINNNEIIEIEKNNSENKDMKNDDEDEELQEEEEDGDIVKDSINLSITSGNNNGSTNSSISSNIDGINSNKNISIIDEHEAIKTTIKLIQTSFRDVKEIILKKDGIVSIGSNQTETILIPSGKSFNFVILFQPKSEDNKKELEEVILHRSVQLKLLSVNSGDVMSQVFQSDQINNDNYISTNQKHKLEPLKPRTLLIRAKTTRSEMVVLQKNISFGRSVVGETSTRGVTIVNRSAVPCMYSISKSGNIASGFLRIPSGRQGYIAPLTSQTIHFVFKPTLSGNFEEIVNIENILDPSNTQSIVIKAKVSKPESFRILPFPSSVYPINTFVPVDISLDESNLLSTTDITNQINQATPLLLFNSLTPSKSIEDFKSLQDIPEIDLENRYKYQLNKSLSRVDVIEGTSITPFFLGNAAVGESCENVISFRIRNVTSKSRTFIVDATQSDAVSLFIPPTTPQIINTNTITELIDENSNYITDKSTDINESSLSKLNSTSPTPFVMLPTVFEPIPETLQSIVRLSCKFEDLNFNVVEDTLSTEQREILADKLEHYNQKLKIAYRKNKPEKISKYEKKVAETKAILSGEKSILDVDEDGDSDKEKESKDNKQKDKKDKKEKKEKKEKKDKDINDDIMKDDDADNDIIKEKDLVIEPNDTIVEPKELTLKIPPEDFDKKLSFTTVDEDIDKMIEKMVDKKVHTTMKMAWDDTAIIDGGNSNSPMKPTFLSASPRNIDSDTAFHVHIGSEQEVSIQIKFTFLPGQSYNSWEGLLPFKGYLRVFECRNEDLIKTIEFGTMLSSSKIKDTSKLIDKNDEDINLEFSLSDFNTRIKDELDSRLRPKTPEPRKSTSPAPNYIDDLLPSTNKSSILQNNDSLLSGFDVYNSKKVESSVDSNNSTSLRGSNKNTLVRMDSLEDISQFDDDKEQNNLKSFFPTIAQWSNIPTKQIYPRYDQHPKKVLGVSLKLVYTKYAFVGALSISSLLPDDATLRLSIIDNFDIHVNRNLDYKLYSPNDHGPISFLTGGTVSIGFGGTGPSTKLTSQVISTQSLTPLPTNASDIKENEVTSTVTSVPVVAEASSFEKYNRSNGSILAKITPNGNVECILEWKLKKEMQKQSVLIAAMLSVQMIVKEKKVGVTQYIPVVFYVDHKSSIKCDKFCSLGEVPIGSTKSSTITIFNESDVEELHYTIVASAPPKALSVVGRVNISSGRTGVILPSSSKEFKMDFNATSIGKFEQQLWISNLRDQFDQKLVAFTATVTVAQSLFVLFPDLESDVLTDKVQKLDFGLIQIKSIEESNHLNIPLDIERKGSSTPSSYLNLTSINDFRYKLRLKNVSKLPLLVTAVSNLKSQCFIFTDEACTQPVVSLLMPQSEETILHIVIKPSSQTSSQWTSSSKTGKDNKESKDNCKSKESQQVDSRNERLFGRELVGGIRLVFFTVEQSQIPVVPTDDLTLGVQLPSISTTPSIIDARKLFETTVVFKAIVGSSLLRIRNLSPKIFVVHTKDKIDNGDASVFSFVKGIFLIENLSSTFPLTYQYIDTHCECEDINGECLIKSEQVIDRKFIIFDSNEGHLSPGESKTITYGIRYKNTISGLMQIIMKVLNVNTKDIQTLELSVFFDKGQIRTLDKSIKPPPLVTIDVNSASSIVTSPLSGPIWLSLASSNSIFASQQHSSRPSSAIQKSSAIIQIDKNPTLLSTNEQIISSTRTSYHVIGSNEVNLCSWVVENTLSHPIVLSPVSDLPITVIFETIDNNTNSPTSEESNSTSSDISGSRRGRGHSFDSMTTNKRGFNSFPSISTSSGISSLFSDTSLAGIKFIKCGESTSIPSGKSRRVVVQCKYGAELSPELLSSLSSSSAALNNGSMGRSTGIVAFMWTSGASNTSTRDLPRNFLNNKNSAKSISKTSPLLSMFANTISENEQIIGHNTKTPLSLITMFSDISQSISDDELTSIHKQQTNKITNKIEKNPNQYNNLSELHPVIGYTQLQCDFIVPLISLTRSQYDLGSIRSGQKISFSISINNNCDAMLPISIEDVPIWMTIEDIDNNIVNNSNETNIETNNYYSKNNNSSIGSLFSIPARSTLVLQAKVLGPKIDAQMFDHTLTIRNLALSSHISRFRTESGSSSDTDSDISFNNHSFKFIGEEFVDVRIKFEIEVTEAIVLMDSQKDSKGRLFIECSDTLIVPSPVQSYDEDVVIEELPLPVIIDSLNLPIISPLSVHGVKNMNKTARISIKNKIKKSLSVAITIEVCKELKEVVNFRVLGSNNSFELHSKETAELRVLIESLRGGRIQPVLPIPSIELHEMVDTCSEVVIIPSISKENNNLLNENNYDASLVLNNNNNNRERDQLNRTTASILNQQNSSSNLTSIIESGRIYFGTIVFQPSIKRYDNSGSMDESVVEINNLQGDIIREAVAEDAHFLDELSFDVYGFLEAGPTHSIARICTAPTKNNTTNATIVSGSGEVSESILVFQAVNKNKTSQPLSTPSKRDENIGEGIRSPKLRLKDETLLVRLSNYSATKNLSFRSSSVPHRHSGMRLIFTGGVTNDRNYDDDDGFYDTVIARIYPPTGLIPPLSSIIVGIRIEPCTPDDINPDIPIVVTKQDRNPEVDGLMTIMQMPLSIWDDLSPLHPPIILDVFLRSDVLLPIIFSQPVSRTNRKKTHLNSYHDGHERVRDKERGSISLIENNINSNSNNAENIDGNDNIGVSINSSTENSNVLKRKNNKTSSSLIPLIRIRGVTPCEGGLFEISLGQQMKRAESIEWQIELENCSDVDTIKFRISSLSSFDDTWLLLNQTKGIITPESGSTSISAYFSQHIVGKFFSYIIVENIIDSFRRNIQILRVSMNVIESIQHGSSSLQNEQIKILRSDSADFSEYSDLNANLNLINNNNNNNNMDALQSKNLDSPSKSSKLNQYSTLESSIISFINLYNLFWADLVDFSNSVSSPSSLEMNSTIDNNNNNNKDKKEDEMNVPKNNKLSSIQSAFEILLNASDNLVITDEMILYKNNNRSDIVNLNQINDDIIDDLDNDQSHSKIDVFACRLASVFLQFFALTDQLTLLALKEYSSASALISLEKTLTPNEMSQSSAYLAHLLYFIVFKHPVFECFLDNSFNNNSTILRTSISILEEDISKIIINNEEGVEKVNNEERLTKPSVLDYLKNKLMKLKKQEKKDVIIPPTHVIIDSKPISNDNTPNVNNNTNQNSQLPIILLPFVKRFSHYMQFGYISIETISDNNVSNDLHDLLEKVTQNNNKN